MNSACKLRWTGQWPQPITEFSQQQQDQQEQPQQQQEQQQLQLLLPPLPQQQQHQAHSSNFGGPTLIEHLVPFINPTEQQQFQSPKQQHTSLHQILSQMEVKTDSQLTT